MNYKTSSSPGAAIGGGDNNNIFTDHSVIAGGQLNTINGKCSAVLGGCNNTINHNWAGVFGCNITTAMDCAFHANNFLINNACLVSAGAPGPLPTGALYVDDVNFPGFKVVLIV